MSLPLGEVRVYWLRHAVTPHEEAQCLALLSAEERRRAAAFARKEPRQQFVAARAMLRLIVGGAVGLAPAAVNVRLGSGGKPETDGLHINLSHSGELIALACCADGPVGIDVEVWDDTVECLEIAQQAFHAADLTRLENAEPHERLAIFFNLWTQREAVAKCLGTGLTDPAALRGELAMGALQTKALSFLPAVSVTVVYPQTVTVVTSERVTLSSLLATS